MKKILIAFLLVSALLVSNAYGIEVNEVEKYVGKRIWVTYTNDYGTYLGGFEGEVKKIIYTAPIKKAKKIAGIIMNVNNELKYIYIKNIIEIEEIRRGIFKWIKK